MKYYLSLLLILFTPISYAQSLIFKNSYIPAAPPTASTMVAYMDIENSGNTDIIINSIKSSDFEIVEVHKTIIENEISTMEKQKSITIPANKTVQLSPGGLHLMLINPKRKLYKGNLVQFEILQSDKTLHVIEISIKRRQDTQHHHH